VLDLFQKIPARVKKALSALLMSFLTFWF